jgi:bifunctional DNA-binding transcriptional regulator/antitoxin component of YhaV-PrlF toxin-antitoxin module
LAENTYHNDMIYIPREIKEKLGLTDGDRLKIEVVEKGEARLRILSSDDATKKLLEMLENPPDLGEIKGTLSKRDL